METDGKWRSRRFVLLQGGLVLTGRGKHSETEWRLMVTKCCSQTSRSSSERNLVNKETVEFDDDSLTGCKIKFKPSNNNLF